MSSLKLLSVSSLLEGIYRYKFRANDLAQGTELFKHMLDSSSDPVSTECAVAALATLIRAGTVPIESCLEQMLQVVQQATSSLSTSTTSTMSSSSISTWTQSAQHMTKTLQLALEALRGSLTKSSIKHITPAALPALLGVLDLHHTTGQRNQNILRELFSRDRSRTDDKARLDEDVRSVMKQLNGAQDTALSILERFSRDAPSRQAFAAAGGIKVLQSGAAAGALWFYGYDRDGFCFLCDLAEDPALTEAVVEAGVVGVFLDSLDPDGFSQEACIAAHALARLAATAQGNNAIAAAPGSMRVILDTLSATYDDCSEEASLVFQCLSLCLFHMARDADSSGAALIAGRLPDFISSMVDAGFNEQQVKQELCDCCAAQAISRLSYMETFGFDPYQAGSDYCSD
jgi:hypothetical protein